MGCSKRPLTSWIGWRSILSTESKRRYPDIDKELSTLFPGDVSELSFMYHFFRLQLIAMRKISDKEVADELLNELELFRQGLLKKIEGIRTGEH
jgi:hypothetical protein